MGDSENKTTCSPELFQTLVLERLDLQHDTMRELKADIRDVQSDLSEIKNNHLLHLTSDTAILKNSIARTEKWVEAHDRRTSLNAREQERGRWEIWVAVVGGCLGVVAAIVTALLHKF